MYPLKSFNIPAYYCCYCSYLKQTPNIVYCKTIVKLVDNLFLNVSKFLYIAFGCCDGAKSKATHPRPPPNERLALCPRRPALTCAPRGPGSAPPRPLPPPAASPSSSRPPTLPDADHRFTKSPPFHTHLIENVSVQTRKETERQLKY